MSTERVYRIFISSPSDVRPERILAERVIRKLDREFQHHCRLEAILWEREPLLASGGFQEQIPEPGRSDIVVVILWSRLGTPLTGTDWTGPLSAQPVTGTEWEFETALKAARADGLPDLLVYRKTAAVTGDLQDRAATVALQQELERLDRFAATWLRQDDGGLVAITLFAERTEFEARLEDHLRGLIRRRLGPVQAQARWHGRPFRGLEAFEAEHAPIFFGRRRATNELIELLARRAAAKLAFVLVIGASGSGKSSLVRAGLLPDLSLPGMVGRVALTRTAVLRPGAEPLAALAAALLQALPELAALRYDAARLARLLAEQPAQVAFALEQGLAAAARTARLAETAEARLLLLVDQLEELFTHQAVGAAERAAFVAALQALATSGLAWVVATLRSDFFERLESLPALAALCAGEGRYLLLPPSDGELGQIVEGPVREAGLDFEVEAASGLSLLEEIRRAAARQPNGLPLLQYLLDQLFDRRSAEGLLTFEAYRQLGGLEGAIGRRAEALLAAQPDEARAAFPLLVRALVSVADSGVATARWAGLADFPAGTPAGRLVEALLAPGARLLVADGEGAGGRVRVAHEALLTHWPQMRAQIEADRKDLQSFGRLEAQAARWHEAGESDDLLLNPGLPLGEAEDLARRRGGELGAGLNRYVARSAAVARARARRRLRRLQVIAVCLALLTLAAGVGAWFGWDGQREALATAALAERQRVEAENQRDEALRQRNAALRNESLFLAAESRRALEQHDSEAALQLALAALPRDERHPDRPLVQEALSALSAASTRTQETALLRGHQGRVVAVGFSPAADRVVTGSEDGTAGVWDVRSGALLARLEGHDASLMSAAFSRDGTRVLTVALDGVAMVWDAASGQALQTLKGADEPAYFGVFSADGRQVAIASAGDVVRVWTVGAPGDGTPAFVDLQGSLDGVTGLAFSPDGTKLATAAADRVARLWDVASGEELAALSGHGDYIVALAFSPDGGKLATASFDTTARLWDLATGRELRVLRGHGGLVYDVRFDADGKRLVTASADATARTWDADSGAALAIFRGHLSPVVAASFSADGSEVLTASSDATARLWDSVNGDERGVFRGHAGIVVAALAGDGTRLVTASGDGLAHLWDLTGGLERAVLGVPGQELSALGVSRDDSLLAAASKDGSVRLWDLPTGRERSLLAGDGTAVDSIAISPEGGRIAMGMKDGSLRLWDGPWDGSGGTQPRILTGHADEIFDVSFSPDGARLVTASKDGTARVWSMASGETLAVWTGERAAWISAARFSPDGSRVVSTAFDGTVALWDPATGRNVFLLEGHTGSVIAVSFSPDGSKLATAATDSTARLWETATGAELTVLAGHGGAVLAANFSPDGTRLVTASFDATARIWDVATGAPLLVLKGHEGNIGTADFSADGALLLTSSFDGTARLWDSATGAELAALRGHAGAILTAHMTKDAATIVTGSSDGTVRLWNVPRAVGPAAARMRALLPVPGEAAGGPATPALAGEAATRCDTLAANPFDPGRVAPGVVWSRLAAVAGEAVTACREALADQAAPRLAYQLARALEAAGDQVAALTAFEAAVAAGYPMAQWRVGGALIEGGLGLPPDPPRGLDLLRRADAGGVTAAAWTQGSFYWNGAEGVARDRPRGLALIEGAAARGDAQSQGWLGWLYEAGRDPAVPADPVAALRHYALAARLYEDLGVIEQADYLLATARRGSLARALPDLDLRGLWEATLDWRPAPVP